MTNANTKQAEDTKVFIQDETHSLSKWALDIVSVNGTTIYAKDPRSEFGGQVILHTSQVIFCK